MLQMAQQGIISRSDVVPLSLVGYSVSSSSDSAPNTEYVTKPTGVQEGDYLIILACNRNSYMTTPSDGGTWTTQLEYTVNSGGISTPPSTNDTHYMWTRFAGASEPSQYGVTRSDDGTDGIAVICLAFRGVDSLITPTPQSGPTSPSITVAAGDILVAYHGTVYDGVLTVGYPTDMEGIGQTYTSAADVGIAAAYLNIAASGATGTKPWSPSWGNNYTLSGIFALRGA